MVLVWYIFTWFLQVTLHEMKQMSYVNKLMLEQNCSKWLNSLSVLLLFYQIVQNCIWWDLSRLARLGFYLFYFHPWACPHPHLPNSCTQTNGGSTRGSISKDCHKITVKCTQQFNIYNTINMMNYLILIISHWFMRMLVPSLSCTVLSWCIMIFKLWY